MIVKMYKAFIVSRAGDRERLLEALRELGAVHLQPVAPEQARPDEKTLARIDHVGRATQLLQQAEPAGTAPDLSAEDAAEEVLDIQRRAAEQSSRLTGLYRQIERLEMWGELRLEQLRALKESGVEVRFFAVEPERRDAVSAECVQAVETLADGSVVLAAASSTGEISADEDARPLELPEQDRPALRAQAAEIDERLKKDQHRLGELANLLPALRTLQQELEVMAEFTAARRGGLEEGQLFAVQGWVPRGRMETLADDLAGQGVDAAVETVDPDPDEKPPTLIRYPRWARPIEALFDILGTVPGYREMDLSPFFMVALPIFAAMLIGDAGYGLVFTLVGLLGYGKIRRAASKSAAQLVLIFGLVTLAWGVLNANYFGLTPPVNEAGEPVGVGKLMAALGPIWDSNDEQMRDTVIQISFIFGTIHLVLAHLRAAFEAAPSQKSVAELGWCGFLAGMLGVVWLMFFPEQVWMPQPVLFALLGGGAGLIVLFSFPQRNPAKRLALGVVGNLMALIAAFSDTMSYIRLMAVGLASYYIAFAFNGLAAQIGSAGWWMIPFAVLILLFAHLLNIALGLIAIFAHGVRLNMLEFSSNAGVQWEGYPFSPFARAATEGER